MNFQLSFKAAFWYGVLFLIAVYFFPESAHAADPSGKAGSFAQGVYGFLTGKWTVSIVAIAFSVAGFLTYRGVIPIMFLISGAVGTFLIYAGFPIGQWLYGLAR